MLTYFCVYAAGAKRKTPEEILLKARQVASTMVKHKEYLASDLAFQQKWVANQCGPIIQDRTYFDLQVGAFTMANPFGKPSKKSISRNSANQIIFCEVVRLKTERKLYDKNIASLNDSILSHRDDIKEDRKKIGRLEDRVRGQYKLLNRKSQNVINLSDRLDRMKNKLAAEIEKNRKLSERISEFEGD